MKSIRIGVVVLVAAILAGCGTLGGTSIPMALDDGKLIKVSVSPIMSVGVLASDAIRQGNFRAYRALFPDGLFSNYHPIRVRYNALAYGQKSGKQYPAQAVYMGYDACELRLAVIVEGNPDEEVTVVLANTQHTELYTALGATIHVKSPEKLTSDANYRREVILSGGTPQNLLSKYSAQDMHKEFMSWGIARVPEQADQLVPWRKETLDFVARINPQFTLLEKCLGVCRFGINPFSLFGTGIGVLEDLFMASQARTNIWDETGNEFEGLKARGIREQFQKAVAAGMVCSGEQRRAQY